MPPFVAGMLYSRGAASLMCYIQVPCKLYSRGAVSDTCYIAGVLYLICAIATYHFS